MWKAARTGINSRHGWFYVVMLLVAQLIKGSETGPLAVHGYIW
jgi:hypothetical protein